MKRELQGRYITISTAGEKAKAFVPTPLPPHPPIDWTPELRSKFDQALLALGRLDSYSSAIPNPKYRPGIAVVLKTNDHAATEFLLNSQVNIPG